MSLSDDENENKIDDQEENDESNEKNIQNFLESRDDCFVMQSGIHKSYIERMKNSREKRMKVPSFEKNDKVYISLDFDNNSKSRKQPLQGYFHEDPFEVIDKLENGQYLVKNLINGTTKQVQSSRLKKLYKEL